MLISLFTKTPRVWRSNLREALNKSLLDFSFTSQNQLLYVIDFGGAHPTRGYRGPCTTGISD